MKFIRTSHLPLSTLRRLQRASLFQPVRSLFLANDVARPRPIDTTLPLFLVHATRELSDSRKGQGVRWCEQEISCTVVIELLVLLLDVPLKTITSLGTQGKDRGRTRGAALDARHGYDHRHVVIR